MIAKLLVSALYNAVLAIILYGLDKKTAFGRLDYKIRQLVYGLCFGMLAIYSSTAAGGVDTGEIILNVRDSAPLCAGLIFGGPAGIIAGFAGGIYRYIATFIGLAGEYTQLACSVSTVLAGIIAAVLRKFMFDDKKPTWIFGIGIAVICEIIHMMMIFFTNMDDPATAFEFVREASMPMILCNAAAVGLALLITGIIAGEQTGMRKGRRYIARTFQFWLFVCIMIAFSVTIVFTSAVQSGITENEKIEIIQTTIDDVGDDIAGAYDEEKSIDDRNEFISKVTKNRHIGKDGYVVICDKDFNIITEGLRYTGKPISAMGLGIDVNEVKENEIFEITLSKGPHMCAYQLVGDYYIIGLIPTEEAMYMRDVSIYINLFMELIIFAALFVLIYFLVRLIVLDNLIKVNSKLTEIAGGNLDVTVDVRSNEEFASLSDDINATVDTLKRYITEAEARIDKELEFARQIQYSSLPAPLPYHEGFEIYADMYTAREVGGDFYDYYMLGGSKLAFLIADVSGKGIPAAMFMMRAKTTIKDLAEQGLEPDEIFTAAGEKLCENNDAFMFVTAWMGILDLKTGILKFANAGHNPPLLCRYGKNFEYFKAKSGPALAVIEDVKYRSGEIQLEPGDRLYLYTDGVTEAMDADGKLYGEKRLQEILNTSADTKQESADKTSPEQLCHTVKASLDGFTGEVSQFDDITMLSVNFNAAVSDNRLKVMLQRGSEKAVNLFAGGIIAKLEIVPKAANRINIIFDEVYSNIMYYSNADMVEISYRIEDGMLYITFKDDGVPYNPLSVGEPDITLSADERDIGGLGILLVRKMSDNIEYKYDNGKNILGITISLRG